MQDKYPRRAAVLPIDESNMVNWYRDLQKQYLLTPDVVISQPADFVSQVHYRDGKRDIYFFSNYGPDAPHTFEARFPATNRKAWLWDPKSGKRAIPKLSANGSLGHHAGTFRICAHRL